MTSKIRGRNGEKKKQRNQSHPAAEPTANEHRERQRAPGRTANRKVFEKDRNNNNETKEKNGETPKRKPTKGGTHKNEMPRSNALKERLVTARK